MAEAADPKRGIVYLVGAGPGDPGLLTVRGRDLLATCDAIATMRWRIRRSLRRRALVNPNVEVHDVGKRGGDSASSSQDEIDALARPARPRR
jgi:uroporphyrinogen III methyltransferase/synthase